MRYPLFLYILICSFIFNSYFFWDFLNDIFFGYVHMFKKQDIFTWVWGWPTQRHILHYVFLNYPLICFFKLHSFLVFTIWTLLESIYENFAKKIKIGEHFCEVINVSCCSYTNFSCFIIKLPSSLKVSILTRSKFFAAFLYSGPNVV